MSDTRTRIAFLLGGAVAIGVGYTAYQKVYAGPRESLRQEIATVRASIASYEEKLDDRADTLRRARELSANTLGADLDTVEHRFRTGLVRVASQEGLTDVVVTAGTPQDQTNPAVNAKGVPTALKRQLRSAPDFSVIRGSVKGKGTLAQVTRALATCQTQPWLARVEGFSIRPVGKDGDRFELKVDVAALVTPKFQGVSPIEPQVIPAADRTLAAADSIAFKNAFRRRDVAKGDAPPPVQVVQAPAQPNAEPPPVQPFAPYEDWRLTGVVVGGTGPEAFFVNTKTGARTTLQKGGQLLDAVLLDGFGETAVIEIAGQRYQVTNGDTLAGRKPAG